MTSSRFDLGSTSKTLNLSLLRFNERYGFQNHECILRDPFLVRIPLIRVSHGAQDVSLYIFMRRGQARPC